MMMERRFDDKFVFVVVTVVKDVSGKHVFFNVSHNDFSAYID